MSHWLHSKNVFFLNFFCLFCQKIKIKKLNFFMSIKNFFILFCTRETQNLNCFRSWLEFEWIEFVDVRSFFTHITNSCRVGARLVSSFFIFCELCVESSIVTRRRKSSMKRWGHDKTSRLLMKLLHATFLFPHIPDFLSCWLYIFYDTYAKYIAIPTTFLALL